MLAIGAVPALRHAVAAFGPPRTEVQLASPATPEAILRAVEAARSTAFAGSIPPPSLLSAL
jgi:xanthine dehydrogenase large subunit